MDTYSGSSCKRWVYLFGSLCAESGKIFGIGNFIYTLPTSEVGDVA